ncbi:Aspartyl/glutamyl-tRNA(Asn/Gln) amidotransferase subunit C [Candidatus Tiddalikarchaeum anstoanum]|nr:Aspartyl/glutamyl-tRNA(Asn/Gln) amidotransferase subunit C [Candidatus Tiddalikarchaeum anstoanum]
MIDKDTVKHVAEIARLKLKDEELELFAKQLNDIVDYFKVLDELNVENVEPSFHPVRTEDVMREDGVSECLDRKKVLEIACHKEGDYFKAPKIM